MGGKLTRGRIYYCMGKNLSGVGMTTWIEKLKEQLVAEQPVPPRVRKPKASF